VSVIIPDPGEHCCGMMPAVRALWCCHRCRVSRRHRQK